MTNERKQEIINEIIPQGERITGIEFINRLTDKAAALLDLDEAKAREYIAVCDEFFENLSLEEIKALKEWSALLPSPEEFNCRLDEKCAGCKIAYYAKADEEAARVCGQCRSIKEQLKANYAGIRCNSPYNDFDLAAGIPSGNGEE